MNALMYSMCSLDIVIHINCVIYKLLHRWYRYINLGLYDYDKAISNWANKYKNTLTIQKTVFIQSYSEIFEKN